MVLTALIPYTQNTWRLFNVLSTNTGIAGLGLFVTAIRQMFANELSLFHAIFVQHILFFAAIYSEPMGERPSVSHPFVSRSDLQRIQANTSRAFGTLQC